MSRRKILVLMTVGSVIALSAAGMVRYGAAETPATSHPEVLAWFSGGVTTNDQFGFNGYNVSQILRAGESQWQVTFKTPIKGRFAAVVSSNHGYVPVQRIDDGSL